jgi:anti-anti-sigma regulatory factor
MATKAGWIKVDGEHVVPDLQDAGEKLGRAGGEMVLDFSSVRRIDAGALREMEKLAAIADEKAVKVELQGVTVGVYKVLKLVRLAPRFTFATAAAQSPAIKEESCHAEPSTR